MVDIPNISGMPSMPSLPSLPGIPGMGGIGDIGQSDWKDTLRPASFRGVPFHVESNALTVGRRLARHEFPQRDIPYMEDMGRAAREYQVEAFVVGVDYVSQRDKLITAIETAGPGQLIHPYYGTVNVVVSATVKISESNNEGGIAKLSIPFLEAGSQNEPRSETDTEAELDFEFDDALDTIAGDFAENFDIEGALDFVQLDALDNINDLLKTPALLAGMGDLSLLSTNPTSLLTGLLPANLMSSIMNPITFAKGIVSLIGGLGFIKTGGFSTSSAGSSFTSPAIASLLDYSLPELATSGYTPSRQTQSDNREALVNLVVQTATATQINDLARSEPRTLDEARAVSAEIVKQADAVLLKPSTGQATSNAIVQLRTAAIQHFRAQTADLPRAVSIVPQANLPAVVIAHDFYGDDWHERALDTDLVGRNRIRHPGFVPAGRAVQLLSE